MNTSNNENRLQHKARSWVGNFARFGYVIKGVLYFWVGFLALKYVLGLSGGGTVNSQQTIAKISQQPFGEVFIIIIAAGLASYALWRYVDAIADVENHGQDLKGNWERIGCLFSGSGYAIFAIWTVMFLLGQASSPSEHTQGVVLLKHAGGRVVIGVIGAVYIGLGIEHLLRVFSKNFTKEVEEYQIDNHFENITLGIVATGILARGIVFLIIGWFISKAAIFYDSSQYIGLGGALHKLLEHRYGRVLLGMVAVGLMAYGIYCFFRARYHQFKNRQ